MRKNKKVIVYLFLVTIIVAIIIGGIVIAIKPGKKQTKESESNNTTNTSQNKTEDYDRNRNYDYDNPEAMFDTYSNPDAYEGEMGVYMVKKDDADFE